MNEIEKLEIQINNNDKKYLPAGTVITLKEMDDKFVIVGYCVTGLNNEIRDYIAITYPVGYMGTESMIVFNEDAIEKLIFEGYQDTEFTEFAERLKIERKKAEEILKETT